MRLVVLLLLAGCAQQGPLVVSQARPQPFCTRTLGTAECFADPQALADRPAPLLDTPVRQHVECRDWWLRGGLACEVNRSARD